MLGVVLGIALIATGVFLYFKGRAGKFTGVVVKQEDIMNARPPFTGGTPAAERVRAVAANGTISERIERVGEEIHIRRGDGVRIWAYPQFGAKMSVQSPEKRPVTVDMRDPKTDCLKTFAGSTTMTGEAKSGEEKVLGYRTVKAVFKSEDRTQTNWYAPELGCVSLQTFVEHVSGQTFVVRAKEVVAGPPSASLFQEPAGLKEMPPSAIAVERMKHLMKSKGLTNEQIESEIANSLAKLTPEIKARVQQQDSQYEAIKLHR